MKVFLQSINIEFWFIINLDPYKATILDANMGRNRPKTIIELSAQDKINFTLNVKVMNVLYNTLDANESPRIKYCKLAKEIWDKLCDMYDGSQNIKEQKKSLLVAKYESFKMESHENVDKIYCKFSDIIKYLELFGKKYTLDEKNRKIFIEFLKIKKIKINAIKESNELNSM